MAEAVLQVEGMSCQHCVNAIESALTKLNGVERSLVDLEKGEVHVQYDENQVSREKMEKVIEETGYEVKH
ncbi:copper chaperone CopZ [Brevibacillus dissolubilis]|uniref:copper chaperone CopZ n=1 Tax=Brevibacillus dissolubilis TaxID=1844116 RepID=UPI0011169D6D|nr:copper chaperone CopZ [Brevibacillus dissolubilis]